VRVAIEASHQGTAAEETVGLLGVQLDDFVVGAIAHFGHREGSNANEVRRQHVTVVIAYLTHTFKREA